MELHGYHLIAGQRSRQGSDAFTAFDPRAEKALGPSFVEATEQEIDQAMQRAFAAWEQYRKTSGSERALFLEEIAEELLALGDTLLQRAHQETGLSLERLTSERARTVFHLRMFAALVREGSWVSAAIDRGDPTRVPPKPDMRKMSRSLGPVVVFGASNFPIAYSVAGGDTASALAAGCSVVVKGHPAHPGTSELVAEAVVRAVKRRRLPEGVFSLVQGASARVGSSLVAHPRTAAVGFTGSLRGGRALFDIAAARPRPIPVYAEMGSVNPVFILPGALNARSAEVAALMHQAVNNSVGQLCVCPGMLLGLAGAPFDAFRQELTARFAAQDPATMLHPGILKAYDEGLAALSRVPGVSVLSQGRRNEPPAHTEAAATLLESSAATVLREPRLNEELFGPATILVQAQQPSELMEIAASLEGHLTATIHLTEEDIEEFRPLIELLETKVGRLIVNGSPVGLELCSALHHGGPYPATTDSRTTSVGPDAIHRFVRPVCYVNVPEALLPQELRNENELGIWRTIDGQKSKDSL